MVREGLRLVRNGLVVREGLVESLIKLISVTIFLKGSTIRWPDRLQLRYYKTIH